MVEIFIDTPIAQILDVNVVLAIVKIWKKRLFDESFEEYCESNLLLS